jgi:exodeoxyribonuclease VII small subunit
MKMTYEKAYKELQQIIQDLQEAPASIDELSAKVKRAAELITFCKDRLRQSESEIKSIFEELE